MNQGWVRIHRKIRDHWLWKDKPFKKGQAWVDMILRANHEDAKIPYENEIIEVPLGSFFSSETALADDWGWSRKKVHNFVETLTKEQMLGTKKHRKGTVFFLINYSNFNSLGTSKEPKKNRSGTAVEPQWNTNNNDNNENNDNNSFSYRKKRGKKKAEINPSFNLEELEEKLKRTVTVI